MQKPNDVQQKKVQGKYGQWKTQTIQGKPC